MKVAYNGGFFDQIVFNAKHNRGFCVEYWGVVGGGERFWFVYSPATTFGSSCNVSFVFRVKLKPGVAL